jgi:hypothetical protein
MLPFETRAAGKSCGPCCLSPLTKVVLEMQGGKKGLLVNSRDVCKHASRATAKLTAHNGKAHNFRPPLRASCGKAKAATGR